MTSSSASSIRIGSYHLGARIGEGGAGEVYRAQGPDGVVAIKLLGPEVAGGDVARARFRREVDALAKVQHPSLVRLIDHGVDDELGPYLVTPLLAGRTLRDALGGHRASPEAAILLAAPIAAAVAALHGAGFVHRDLKPENVMATPTGEVIVIDLGLAWREGGTRHTDDGTAVGSVGYMAPEQIEGGEVGPGADAWAIGVMLYEWVVGRRPFARARASEEAAASLVGAFTPLAAAERRAGDALSTLVGACLAADPARRPTLAALARQLEALIDWLPADDEGLADRAGQRAAVLDDPEGFVARVAAFRVRRLERQAREAVDAGRPFAALAMLDRALAYQPGRRELEALVAEVEAGTADLAPVSGGPDVTPATAATAAAPVASPRRSWIGTALIAAAAAAVAAAAVYTLTRPEPPGAAAPVAAPPTSDAGPSGPIDPALGDVDLAASPLADLPPIPLDQLRNDAAPFELPSAPAGEPIVDPRLLGGRSPDEAVAEVDAMLAASPGDRNALFGRAMVYLAAGRDKRGLALLDEALRLHPDHAPGWAGKAYVEVRRGRWDAAEQAFARALELDAADGASLRNRGIMRHRGGRVRDAYQDLRSALAIDPGDVEAMYELIQLYARLERSDDTRKLLERVARMRPDHPQVWLDLSQTQGNADALLSIRKALAIDPASMRGHQRLCNVLVMMQDAGALAACDDAVARSPEHAPSLGHRGIARYLAGDDAAALVDLDRAIELDPSDGEVWVNRAMVRTHAGHPGARADLEQACKLDVREACGSLKSGSNLKPPPLVP